MLKNATSLNTISVSKSSNQSGNNVEQLVHRLLTKISSIYNLNDKLKEEFINNSYAYMVQIFSYNAYATVHDSFEVSEKIKNKCKTFKNISH